MARMGEEDFSQEVTSELGPDIEEEVTFSGKNITNKCKVQREKRAWCISRMERRPVMKKQEVRGRYITKLWVSRGRALVLEQTMPLCPLALSSPPHRHTQVWDVKGTASELFQSASLWTN